jgi:hypothetical protein
LGGGGGGGGGNAHDRDDVFGGTLHAYAGQMNSKLIVNP